MIPATGLKTSLLSLSLLQQIDLALFNKVFGYGKARQALTHTALAVSKVGMGRATTFTFHCLAIRVGTRAHLCFRAFDSVQHRAM